jgi:multiple sugar transport system substrate-binding protein
MKKLVYVLILLALLAAACSGPAPKPQPVEPQAPAQPVQTEAPQKTTLRALYMQQAGYQESDITAITKEYTDKNPNVDVQLDFVSYEALHDKIVTAAASQAGTYDVVLIDCIWPAEFAAAGFIKDVTDKITPDMQKDIWPGALGAVTYKGKMYGMPWLNDVLYLYYNEEMLQKAGFTAPPKTWSEVKDMSMAAKEKGVVQYPFIEYFQQDEGLTIAYAYYLAAFGGKFFDENDNPVFNSPEGKAALDYLVAGVKDGMYNPASMESTYEEVRRTYSQGESLFSVNWTYQLNMSNDPKESKIAGKSKIALMPGEKLPSATINGGMGLAIMSTSKNPDQAWDYILYMSSKDVQKRFSANALPIWISLFDDPDLMKAQGDFITLSKDQYQYMVNRPIVPFYSETSKILSRELQAALTGAKTAEQALADATTEIQQVHDQYKPPSQ